MKRIIAFALMLVCALCVSSALAYSKEAVGAENTPQEFPSNIYLLLDDLSRFIVH